MGGSVHGEARPMVALVNAAGVAYIGEQTQLQIMGLS